MRILQILFILGTENNHTRCNLFNYKIIYTKKVINGKKKS
jgi:hypothetical protein